MKKLICVVLVLLMLCGCSANKTESETEPRETSEQETAARITAATEQLSDYEKAVIRYGVEVSWCEKCVEYYPEECISVFHGWAYCASCLADELDYLLDYASDRRNLKCRVCGSFFDKGDVWEDCAEYGICEDCAPDYFGMCYKCGEYAEKWADGTDFALCKRCLRDHFWYDAAIACVDVTNSWDWYGDYYDETHEAVTSYLLGIAENAPD